MSKCRHPFSRGLLGFGIILLPLFSAAADLQLKPFEARFQVSRNKLTLGTLDIKLSISDQGIYSYTGHTKPGAVINWFISDEIFETSEGDYVNNRIIPDSYEYQQEVRRKIKKQTQLEFDWPAGKVWTESEGKRWAQPLVSDTHDKYSQQLALRLDLANGEREVSYPVADGGRIKTYYYRVVGEDTINLPYGRLKCVRVRRSKESKPPDYTIWFAPELDYLPVKIERKRSSGKYAIELMRLAEGK